MEININWLAVVLAFVVGMIVAMVWYDKRTVGPAWTKLTGVKKANKAAFVGLFITNFLTALVLAIAISISTAYFKNDSLWLALTVGLVAWLGFSASTLAQHNGFELKPAKLTVINASYHLVLMLSMTLIIWLLTLNY